MTREHSIARKLLETVRLANLLGADGRPTDASWERLGTLSSGELTIAAVAFSIAGGYTVTGREELNRLGLLDIAALRAVGEALVTWAGGR